MHFRFYIICYDNVKLKTCHVPAVDDFHTSTNMYTNTLSRTILWYPAKYEMLANMIMCSQFYKYQELEIHSIFKASVVKEDQAFIIKINICVNG